MMMSFSLFSGSSSGTARTRLAALIFLPLVLIGGALWLSACQGGEEGSEVSDRVSALFEPLPEEAPVPDDNPMTEARVDLGHKLYFEPKLSRSGTISCNTCHVVGAAGVDHRAVAIGEGAREGRRNSPTVYNAAFLESQFWDGRAETLEEQAKGPIQAHVEMDLTKEEAVSRLRATGYLPLFKKAFPKADTALTFDHIADAIAAFERTLTTPGAPFDRYLEGNEAALSTKQKAGLELFMNSGCAGCHRGPMLGGQGYANFSHAKGDGDVGRAEVTGDEADRYSFRIASLRNVEKTYPYFHDGSAKTLREAVSIMGESQLGRTFNEQEVERLVAFLESLTGEFPSVPYPKLPRTPGSGASSASGSPPSTSGP
jgi:cytochrome c peroxidase